MANTTTRLDLRTEIRDNIQEASGVNGAIFTDDVLNRAIKREILSLPTKEVYLEEAWTQTLDPTEDYTSGLVLPSGTVKVEGVERNDGDTTHPNWSSLSGIDNYGGSIFLPYTVTSTYDIRVRIKRTFTVPTDDVTALDVPDDKCELIVWGVTIRCLKILIGYLTGSKSWDSVTKPGDLQITVVQNWLRDATREYDRLIKQYATSSRPRFIDLTS